MSADKIQVKLLKICGGDHQRSLINSPSCALCPYAITLGIRSQRLRRASALMFEAKQSLGRVLASFLRFRTRDSRSRRGGVGLTGLQYIARRECQGKAGRISLSQLSRLIKECQWAFGRREIYHEFVSPLHAQPARFMFRAWPRLNLAQELNLTAQGSNVNSHGRAKIPSQQSSSWKIGPFFETSIAAGAPHPEWMIGLGSPAGTRPFV